MVAELYFGLQKSERMNYWVVSPNVTNIKHEEQAWKAAILKYQVAIMGWDEENKFGRMFIEDIQIGDVILIAQGANWQKRLYLAGRAASPAFQKHLLNTPRSAWQRELIGFIKAEELNAMEFDFAGSAYGDTSQIPAIYRLKPWQNEKDKAIAEQLAKAIIKKIEQENMNNIIELLKYKKQIILQGPPGTGKTRLAKELAAELIGAMGQMQKPVVISDKDIQRILNVGLRVDSIAEGAIYEITNILQGRIVSTKLNGTSDETLFVHIRNAYESQSWLNTPRGNPDRRAFAFAKYIYDKITVGEEKFDMGNSDQFRLIQFHASYSYEDFVRGIAAKPNEEGEGILYQAENKVLARFAKVAYQNYLNSQKPSETLSKEQWLDAEFELFTDMVAKEVSEKGKYELTEKAYVYKVDAELFRYKGDDWAIGSRRRMKFSDLKMEYLADVHERKDIKNLTIISGEVREESTYGLIMVNKLRGFISSNKSLLTEAVANEQERKYVLIVDEINRANLSSVLGELIYGLEYRGEYVESMYEVDGSNVLILPPNLYIIGTMNTADRSVGHIDYAIRRRFAFVDVLPKDLSTDLGTNFHKVLFDEVAALFDSHLSNEFEKKDVQLGHSYFIDKTAKGGSIAVRLHYEIKPLLMEYIKDGVLKDSKELRAAILNLEQKIV